MVTVGGGPPSEVDELRAFRADLESSVAWKLLTRYRRLLATLAPPGSRQRRGYDRARKRVAHRGRRWPSERQLQVAAAQAIQFEPTDNPTVSVIIPVYGHVDMTLQCLASIAEHGARLPFEVIVVDDASPDDTRRIAREVTGLRTVANPINVGFVKSCNAGAEASLGKYLVFLNNDTVVHSGWLDLLVETAEHDPAVGVVGAKLVYADGSLQEAGGIVWSDGNGWNYGRNQDPNRFEYNWVREVDYCSGAALLVRADVFRAIRGFDEQFAPAYYEDTDLCFAVRERGLKVVYQPRSVVTHFEGRTNGTDMSSGVKRHQLTNRRKFATKWAHELVTHASSTDAPVISARSRSGPHVLIVDHYVPRFLHDSGSLRMTQIVRSLTTMGYTVHLVPDNGAYDPYYTPEFQKLGVEVFYGPADPMAYLDQLGPNLAFAILSRPHVAWRWAIAIRERAPGVPILYDMVDSHALREQRKADLDGSTYRARLAGTWAELEAALARTCDATIAVSREDEAYLRALAPASRIFVLPNVHEAQPRPAPLDGRQGLLFVGSYEHPPNIDAARLLVREVLPRVAAKLGPARLVLAGANPTPEIQRLAADTIEVPGWVDDLTPLFDRARVFVAPLRYGAGVKGKIGEALSKGLPIVTTSIGAEGLELVDRKHALIVEDVDGIVGAVVELCADDQLWKHLSNEGRAFVEERYGLSATRTRLAAILTEMSVPRPPGSRASDGALAPRATLKHSEPIG